MTVLANDFAPGWYATTSHGAMDPYLSEKAGPVNILPHLPACFRHRRAALLAELAEVRNDLDAQRAELAEAIAGLDVLNLGVIEADLNGSRANARVDQVFDAMRELADEVRDHCPAPEPAYDERHVIEAEMPAGHPDSMTRELDLADEEAFIALCCTEDWRECGGAT
jgi:hypothetical protein